MVVPTLVHEHYRFINEGYLPEPAKGGLVGILCQECSTPLRYHSALEDSWRIHCPTLPKNNQHNWRTWRCDQLNHERALINAGAPRPIVSSSADWGSRISPFGVLLDPKPPKSSKHLNSGRTGTSARTNLLPNPLPNADHHPFLGRQPSFNTFETPQLDSLAGPHRAKVTYPCQRPSRGPTARTHRTTGNKGCPHQYCQACCLEFGLGGCSKHTRPNPGHTANTMDATFAIPRHPSQLIPASASTSLAASPTSQPTPEVGRARTGRIHQWAQSANTLGRLLAPQTVANIQNDRRERYEQVERQIATKYDESKVVTILLWLDEIQAKVISAHFDQWPKARLDESSLLIQACTQALGPMWNRALLFWDEKIDSWHETMVTFPHRFPSNNKIIVVRSPEVDPQTPGMPQSKSRRQISTMPVGPVEQEPPGPTPLTSTSTSHANTTPLRATTPPDSDGEEITVVKSTMTSTSDPNRASLLDSDSDDSVVVVKSNYATTMISTVKVEASEDLPIFDPFDESPITDVNGGHRPPKYTGSTCTSTSSVGISTPSTSSAGKALKKKWPGPDILVTTLLAWYKQCETRPPLQAWKDVWADEWVLVPSTVYRNRLWVERVGYKRFSDQYRKFPCANVGEARILYKKEFQAVANV